MLANVLNFDFLATTWLALFVRGGRLTGRPLAERVLFFQRMAQVSDWLDEVVTRTGKGAIELACVLKMTDRREAFPASVIHQNRIMATSQILGTTGDNGTKVCAQEGHLTLRKLTPEKKETTAPIDNESMENSSKSSVWKLVVVYLKGLR